MELSDIEERAGQLARVLIESMSRVNYTLVLAESCTAGLVADLLARVSGASAVLWGSFVCYSPQAKQRMLGIDDAFLRQYGVVSAETAGAMAAHALARAGVTVAAAVTGLAGPGGDAPEYSGGNNTPVGTVWIAVAGNGRLSRPPVCLYCKGSRAEIRIQAAAEVLEALYAVLDLPLDK